MLERREMILKILDENGKAKVSDLAKRFQCSEVTICTDIRALEKEGLVDRIRGGVQKKTQNQQKFGYDAISLDTNVAAKQKIAACAYKVIDNQDTIILDDSSTSFYLALQIRKHPQKRMAVVTNSLLAASELSGLAHVELYLVGGNVKGSMPATIGKKVTDNIMSFHADKAFVGVHGISFEKGLTCIVDSQMQIKKAIIETTKYVYVLADSSKFGCGYFWVVCPITDIYEIITDNGVTQENIDKAEKNKVPLVIA